MQIAWIAYCSVRAAFHGQRQVQADGVKDDLSPGLNSPYDASRQLIPTNLPDRQLRTDYICLCSDT